ncbi:MAG TPA: hypothetical protein DCY88_02785 [Cyanobacteria bacterium UBA11372]|nr:hypothetical protein [Cyanobacteria bacterium UBA11372]
MTTTTSETQKKPNPQAWYKPTFSPEHGVYVMLLVSFLTGAAAAQNWTLLTTLALVCAFFGFQAEHPLVLQIKQRKSVKPRFLVWGGLYGVICLAIALYLYLRYPILLWIYLGAIAALIIDAFSVFHREQKSILNEIVTFAAVCLSAPFAYAATTGTSSTIAIGLWAINTVYFCSTIFSVKLRKPKTSSVVPGVVYHAIATLIISGLYWLNWLSLVTALALGVALLKFSLIIWQKDWYRDAKIQFIAILETSSALIFLAIAAFSVLPTRLPVL